MLTATYRKSSKTLIYWRKSLIPGKIDIARDYCDSEIVAKLTVMEQSLRNKITQKLNVER